jgi:thiol:disulfide interchange protein DsbG
MNRTRLLAAIAFSLAFPVMAREVPPAHTQLFPTLSLAQANAVVASASHGNAHALSVFQGRDGLIGVVYAGTGGAKGIVWLTPHGEAVITDGHLVDQQGADLTRQAMYTQGVLASPAEALTAAMAPARMAIRVGAHGPVLAVLFDPNCAYCHQLYAALSSAAVANDVQVRYVVVGTLKATSIPRAASILADRDPAKALAMNETDFDTTKEEGGYPVAKVIRADIKAAVESNNGLFNHTGAVGTPTILYCDKATGTARMRQGIPADIATFIAQAGPVERGVCVPAPSQKGVH